MVACLFLNIKNLFNDFGLFAHNTATVTLEASGFTTQVAQVVQFGTAHTAPLEDGQFGDGGGIVGKNPLHTFVKADFTHGKTLTNARIVDGNNHTFKGLNTGTGTLGYFYIHPNGVARLKVGDVGAEMGLGNALQNGSTVDAHV